MSPHIPRHTQTHTHSQILNGVSIFTLSYRWILRTKSALTKIKMFWQRSTVMVMVLNDFYLFESTAPFTVYTRTAWPQKCSYENKMLLLWNPDYITIFLISIRSFRLWKKGLNKKGPWRRAEIHRKEHFFLLIRWNLWGRVMLDGRFSLLFVG